MGYKRAGCTIVAANDIDPEMARHYKRNLNPKHYFLCPIKELVGADLPKELFELDILDGSPPCSTFSMAGSREKAWGVEKKFREGQAKQVLSDLFFDFLDLANYLKPKVIVAENVKGMVIGNAKGYARLVMDRLREIGYRPQLFLVNAVDCGVPQRRERVFFCAVRNDVSSRKLSLSPSMKPIPVRDAVSDLQVLSSEEKEYSAPKLTDTRYWALTKPGSNYADACELKTGKSSCYTHTRISGDKPSPTVTAQDSTLTHWSECRLLTLREVVRIGSFPDDYQFESTRAGKYMIGMSVPPKMAEVVARAVIDQWLTTTPSRHS